MDWDAFCTSVLPSAHSISVEARTGTGAYGDVYAAAANVTPCYVDRKRRRVRISTQDAAGAEVLSETTVYCPADTTAPPGSRITLADGTVTRVLTAVVRDAAGLPLPEHLELTLE